MALAILFIDQDRIYLPPEKQGEIVFGFDTARNRQKILEEPKGYHLDEARLLMKSIILGIDTIIIGHNNGGGLSYASIVPQHLKARTIIVVSSKDVLLQKSNSYQQRGFRHIYSRGELEGLDKIRSTLEQFDGHVP